MSNAHHPEHDAPHEGPIKTPKQLMWAVVFSFLVPILVIVLLVNYVASADKPMAGKEEGMSSEAVATRIQRVGMVEIKDQSDPGALKKGDQVYTAQCQACHGAGVAGAPKFGDEAAWAPRIKAGYEALLGSALKGKGAMGPQGGGDFSDLEIGRAVVHMVNGAGGKFSEPQAVVSAASAPAAATSAEATLPVK